MLQAHVIAPFNVAPAGESSWFPYAAKVLSLARMLRRGGWRVVEYGSGRSESEADEKVTVVSEAELAELSGPEQAPERGSGLWKLFDGRLRAELAARSLPGDVVAHVLGACHRELVGLLPDRVHVETGVGYSDYPFGAIRIFESRAWRAYMLGAADGARKERSRIADPSATFVVPMAFDLDEWPIGGGSGDARGPYFVHLGRCHPAKGTERLAQVVEIMAAGWPEAPRLVVAGRGGWDRWAASLSPAAARLVEVRPEVTGRGRADLLGRAIAGIYPTAIQEPFGAAAVEGMLCGTPAIASAWGAFEENILHGFSGYCCREPAELVASMRAAALTPRMREGTARWARARFAIEECSGPMQRAIAGAISLWGRGDDRGDDVSKEAA